MNVIRINTDASIRREAISEDQYCVIVDDFLQNPHALVEFAAQHSGNFSVPESKYPGLLCRINNNAMTDIYRFIRSKMTKHFPILRGGMKMWTVFSMVTLQPDELSTFQRLCHTDPVAGPDRMPYAALLYLFENEDHRERARYMTESNEIAELLCTIPARFNHLVFYSGTEPHSAAITAPEFLSKDFRKGRLTLNVFADVLPR